MTSIKVDEFKQRLEILCLKGGGRGLPRKPRDRQILFKSMTLMLDNETTYSEAKINRQIEIWLAEIGSMIEIDHVTLRRYLVDEGYLSRDEAGVTYRVSIENTADLFEAAINQLDPLQVVDEAREDLARKKRAYLENQSDRED